MTNIDLTVNRDGDKLENSVNENSITLKSFELYIIKALEVFFIKKLFDVFYANFLIIIFILIKNLEIWS